MCNEQGMSVYDNHADTYFTSGGDVVVLASFNVAPLGKGHNRVPITTTFITSSYHSNNGDLEILTFILVND